MVPPDVQLMIDKICRSCMCESTEMINVFEKSLGQGEETVLLSDMLISCAQIEVISGDGLPYLLCSTCESKLNVAFDFKTQCQKSDGALRELTQLGKKEGKEDSKIDIYDSVLTDSDADDVPLIQKPKSEKLKDNDSLSCKYCQKILPGKRALRVHTRLHKDDSMRYCPVCPSKYTKLPSLLKHMKKHSTNGRRFTCAICLTKFDLAEDLYTHLGAHKADLTAVQEVEKVKPIKVKIEVKEEGEDLKYESAEIVSEKLTEEIRIEIESNKRIRDDDTDSMDIPLNQFPFSDNEDAFDKEYTAIENSVFKKRKRGRPRTRDRSKGYPCTVCGKVLASNLGLRIHMKTHGITVEPMWRKKKKLVKESGEMKQGVECEFCDRRFKYKKSYSQHMRLEHQMSDNEDILKMDDENMECEKTDPSTTSNNNEISVSRPMLSPDRNDLLEIALCVYDEGSKEQNDTSTNAHLEQIVNDENVPHQNKNAVKVKKVHECQVCSAQFNRANHLTRHMTLHRAVLKHKCKMCDQSFHQEQLLERHVEEQHNNKPYMCTICVKSFTRGEHLIRHLKTHKNDVMGDLKCSICDMVFSRLDTLAKHTKSHLMQDKRHICIECGKAFNRLDNLKTHQKIHTGLKDNSKLHLCVYCGKEFNNSSNMIVHMRRHTGERPYKCSVCDKGFPRSHDLKCHERTHSGEKPYLCTLCGKSFNKSNKLLRHSRVHTGERPYVCNICGRAFTQSNDLSLHMRRHTGARPYACGVCPARFIQSGQLKSHRRTSGHWMETQPDLIGGHRVEQISGPVEPIPIRFRKYNFPKKEMDDDITDDTVEIVETQDEENRQNKQQTAQPHKMLMNIMGKLSQSEVQSLIIDSSKQQSLIIDSNKLVELQGGGFGIMTLPSSAVIQTSSGQQIKLKTEDGSFSLEHIDHLDKDETMTTSDTYSRVTASTFTAAEGFGFQTFD